MYGDFKGKASADRIDAVSEGLAELAAEKGIDLDGYFIVGSHFWSGENHAGRPLHYRIEIYAVSEDEVGDDIPAIQKFVDDNGGTLPVREFTIDATIEEYFMCFKRYSVELVHRGIKYEELEIDLD